MSTTTIRFIKLNRSSSPKMRLKVCHIDIPIIRDNKAFSMYFKELFLIQTIDMIAEAKKATNVATDAPRILKVGTNRKNAITKRAISTSPMNRIFLY